jgi:Fur family ferric uptake transcriptional regulator
MPQRLKPIPTTESNDLRNAGLKVTLPRLKILDILADGSARHMSAEDIYKKLLVSNEDIGLATVYRVLTQFEAAGLVTRHHFEGGMAVFELNQGAHHDHIVCVDCGKVEEFMDGGIEERQHAVAKRLGFEISDHALILYGHCRKPNCPNQKRPKVALARRSAPRRGRARSFFTRFRRRGDRASMSRAWARACSVMSMPPSMRAISSTRSAPRS